MAVSLRPRLSFVLGLLLLVLPAYAPALNRFFASDQFYYFLEQGYDFRLSSTLRLWDYTAQRQYDKGDELLFRPLTGILLAVETSLFQYRVLA